MSPVEMRAFNAGVLAVFNIALQASASARSLPWKPAREGAADALAELADAGRALLISDGRKGDSEPAGAPLTPWPIKGEGAAAVGQPLQLQDERQCP